MLFSIAEDTASRIAGWVMPDNPATTPKVFNQMSHSIGKPFDRKNQADGRRRLRAANGPPDRRFRRGRERRRLSCREPAAVAVD
jgi:hypothetical protein